MHETLWIVKGRTTVKKILHKCVMCKRFEDNSIATPISPQLPEGQISAKVSFTMMGMDFAGPLYVQSPMEPHKTYINIL